MTQRFFVRGPLPGLNELIRAKGNTRYQAYNKLKREWMKTIQWELVAGKIIPVSKAFFRFTWHEASRRRDLDNITAGGRKLILDALVLSGILSDDGWDEVSGWSDEFKICKTDPGVEVEMDEA
jgi:Holliday junction resolvase RusA-like endonuclease